MKNLILIALVTIAIATANATIIEIPLDITGQYDFRSARSSSFDFGVSFSQINDIYIDWSGQVVGAELQMGGVTGTQFVATLYESDPQSYYARASVYGGRTTYPTPEPFNLQSSFTDEGWAEFYDGQGNIKIWFGDSFHPDMIVSQPTGQINSATLVIDGVIVPEPMTIILFGTGSLFVFRKKRHNVSPN